MAFDGMLIGISDGLQEGRHVLGGLPLGAACPKPEPPPGPVEQVLLPGDCNHLDLPAGLAELVP